MLPSFQIQIERHKSQWKGQGSGRQTALGLNLASQSYMASEWQTQG